MMSLTSISFSFTICLDRSPWSGVTSTKQSPAYPGVRPHQSGLPVSVEGLHGRRAVLAPEESLTALKSALAASAS